MQAPRVLQNSTYNCYCEKLPNGDQAQDTDKDIELYFK